MRKSVSSEQVALARNLIQDQLTKTVPTLSWTERHPPLGKAARYHLPTGYTESYLESGWGQ